MNKISLDDIERYFSPRVSKVVYEGPHSEYMKETVQGMLEPSPWITWVAIPWSKQTIKHALEIDGVEINRIRGTIKQATEFFGLNVHYKPWIQTSVSSSDVFLPYSESELLEMERTYVDNTPPSSSGEE